jgi:hypothetical protein
MHKEKVNVIDEANGVKALAQEWDLRTNVEIAKKLGRKPTEIGLLLRLLKLPIGVQRHIAAGPVPKKAERQLREVTKVSPRIAECVCEFAARKKVSSTDFTREFDQLLLATTEARFAAAPTMIRAGRVRFGEVISDKKKREELTSRFNAALPSYSLEQVDPIIRLNDAELDAARALRCLVEYASEHRTFVKRVEIVTDKEVAADLVEQRIERMETEAVEREAVAQGKGGKPGQKEKESQKLSDQYKKREKDKVTAEQFNEELFSGLTNRNAAARRKHDLRAMKAIAKVFIANNPTLAAAGLRFVRPALKDVETKTTKSGEPRKKVSYATTVQASSWLIERVDDARSGAEIRDLLTETMISALVADQKAVAASNQVDWRCPVLEEVGRLLATVIEEVSPAKPSAKKAGARRRGGRKGSAK